MAGIYELQSGKGQRYVVQSGLPFTVGQQQRLLSCTTRAAKYSWR